VARDGDFIPNVRSEIAGIGEFEIADTGQQVVLEGGMRNTAIATSFVL
jgi:hypothetical protein